MSICFIHYNWWCVFVSAVKSTVREALKQSLLQILAHNRVDILRDAMAAKEKNRPYVITFCGVNGVGKSTNLSKVSNSLKSELYVWLCCASVFNLWFVIDWLVYCPFCYMFRFVTGCWGMDCVCWSLGVTRLELVPWSSYVYTLRNYSLDTKTQREECQWWSSMREDTTKMLQESPCKPSVTVNSSSSILYILIASNS